MATIKRSRRAVQTYELTTVTYGTASASYLTIKALQQTAIAIKDSQPFGAEIILRYFYVDDLLTGINFKTEAQRIIAEVRNILEKGKFELKKWASNEPELLQTIPTSCSGSTILNLDKSEGVNTLGLQWSTTDTLQYSLIPITTVKIITKRQIVSHISKIFDPLGLVRPFTIRAKILMQEIWKLKVDWNESLPLKMRKIWSCCK
ncbi:Pao retrotransposon peptidase [Popillia japonica]|uniref:Pao retrotransposon peptidase n=1 Tax=Popillia japonica TaxID=7064 RepID=A0AAW1LSJ6_POPJA